MQELETRLAEMQNSFERLKLMDSEKNRAFLQLKNQVEFLLSSVQANGKNSSRNVTSLLNAAKKSLLVNLSMVHTHGSGIQDTCLWRIPPSASV